MISMVVFMGMLCGEPMAVPFETQVMIEGKGVSIETMEVHLIPYAKDVHKLKNPSYDAPDNPFDRELFKKRSYGNALSSVSLKKFKGKSPITKQASLKGTDGPGDYMVYVMVKVRENRMIMGKGRLRASQWAFQIEEVSLSESEKLKLGIEVISSGDAPGVQILWDLQAGEPQIYGGQ